MRHIREVYGTSFVLDKVVYRFSIGQSLSIILAQKCKRTPARRSSMGKKAAFTCAQSSFQWVVVGIHQGREGKWHTGMATVRNSLEG